MIKTLVVLISFWACLLCHGSPHIPPLAGSWESTNEQLGSDGHLRKYYSKIRFEIVDGILECYEIWGLKQTHDGKVINHLHSGAFSKNWYFSIGSKCWELTRRDYRSVSLDKQIMTTEELEKLYEKPVNFNEKFSRKERNGPLGKKGYFREFIVFFGNDEFVRVREDLGTVFTRRYHRVTVDSAEGGSDQSDTDQAVPPHSPSE